jgi:predicted metal-dependent HD superfamily phosphohydrolase
VSADILSGAAWQRVWTALGAQVINGGLMNQLVAAYSERQRHYHTLQHLRECLAQFDAGAVLARRPAEVELALWFHDAIYDPQGRDNEERSADWARASVLAAGCEAEVADRVAGLVLSTRGHDAAADDVDAHLLLDVDLSILGAAPARFDQYEQQVRAEYAHVPDEAFRAGRRRVLEGFLGRPRIYRTAAFHDALEVRARTNLQRSLAALAA